MKYFIKNMVCDRCKMSLENIFNISGAEIVSVELGEIEVAKKLNESQLSFVEQELKIIGFELIDDKKGRTIEKIKTTVREFVQANKTDVKINFSDYLTDKMHYDYNYLSNLFSQIEGITIEKYLINQKIERVKELLVYDELSLSEVAFKLGYSSVAHLSSQFKKATGLTPSYFKSIKENKRISLDKI